MTYGPRMSEDNARAFSDKAAEYGIQLTVHASYFIVLTTRDESNVDRAYKTLEKTCYLARAYVAHSVLFCIQEVHLIRGEIIGFIHHAFKSLLQ